MKRQSTHWEKIVAKHLSDKGILSKYMRTSQNSIKRKTAQFKNMFRKVEQKLHVGDVMSHKHMEGCQTLLVIREMWMTATHKKNI